MARNPSRWRARISASKPVASAQAPWTRTIVGLLSSGWVAMSAPLVHRVSLDRREQSPPHGRPPQAGGRAVDQTADPFNRAWGVGNRTVEGPWAVASRRPRGRSQPRSASADRTDSCVARASLRHPVSRTFDLLRARRRSAVRVVTKYLQTQAFAALPP